MDLGDLRKLMEWAARAPVSEVEFVDGGVRLHLKKSTASAPAPQTVPTTAPTPKAAPQITAPVFGLFYLRPAPDAEPFVSVGQRIRAGDIVGIVEAMKTFNQVVSEIDGVVDAILVESGTEVEVGQPLLSVSYATEDA